MQNKAWELRELIRENRLYEKVEVGVKESSKKKLMRSEGWSCGKKWEMKNWPRGQMSRKWRDMEARKADIAMGFGFKVT